MFEHAVNIETVVGHQVEVTDSFGSNADIAGHDVVTVDDEDADAPVAGLDERVEVFRVVSRDFQVGDDVEVVLGEFDGQSRR